MTAREWQPGDVAVVTRKGTTRRCVRLNNGTWEHFDDREFSWHDPDDVRPLVVIDPEDDSQVERLHKLMGETFGSVVGLGIALREFADPTPPKPAEPTGLGAVVEDGAGNLWVRGYPGNGDGPAWYCDDPRGGDLYEDQWKSWSDVQAVKVLSEGVTA